MEYVGSNSLQSYLKEQPGRKLTELEAKRVFKQVIMGVDYLHANGISHRDIKLDNILLGGKDKDVKIIDFGFSVLNSAHVKQHVFCGTPSKTNVHGGTDGRTLYLN